MQHQYIERESRTVKAEQFYGDTAIRFIYSRIREQSSWIFQHLISARVSQLLSFMNYDGILSDRMNHYLDLHRELHINPAECLEELDNLNSLRKIFERKIRYWKCRPIPSDPCAILSPADSRMIFGSFQEESCLFIKDKFFDYHEMFGANKHTWLTAFQEGDFAIFRLTPEMYHYNHTPVAGKILDFYQIQGTYHACNPHAIVSVVTPYSKNKRVVTIIDTNVPGGTKAGLVAMVEVVALMIGDIVQCYSEKMYEKPVSIGTGMYVRQGVPKSLFRPGSSTVVLIFQKNRVRFADDIAANMFHPEAQSIYSKKFGRTLVETEVKVRSFIASARQDRE